MTNTNKLKTAKAAPKAAPKRKTQPKAKTPKEPKSPKPKAIEDPQPKQAKQPKAPRARKPLQALEMNVPSTAPSTSVPQPPQTLLKQENIAATFPLGAGSLMPTTSGNDSSICQVDAAAKADASGPAPMLDPDGRPSGDLAAQPMPPLGISAAVPSADVPPSPVAGPSNPTMVTLPMATPADAPMLARQFDMPHFPPLHLVDHRIFDRYPIPSGAAHPGSFGSGPGGLALFPRHGCFRTFWKMVEMAWEMTFSTVPTLSALDSDARKRQSRPTLLADAEVQATFCGYFEQAFEQVQATGADAVVDWAKCYETTWMRLYMMSDGRASGPECAFVVALGVDLYHDRTREGGPGAQEGVACQRVFELAAPAVHILHQRLRVQETHDAHYALLRQRLASLSEL